MFDESPYRSQTTGKKSQNFLMKKKKQWINPNGSNSIDTSYKVMRYFWQFLENFSKALAIFKNTGFSQAGLQSVWVSYCSLALVWGIFWNYRKFEFPKLGPAPCSLIDLTHATNAPHLSEALSLPDVASYESNKQKCSFQFCVL